MNKLSNWISHEFRCVSFGDKRINSRFLKVAQSMSEQPENTICRALENWSAVKAAYRLFDNLKVTPSKIMAPHIKNTIQRCKNHKTILAIQDTSYLTYTNRKKTKDLTPINNLPGNQTLVKGFLVHSTMALTPEGVPLGILNQDFGKREKILDKKKLKISYQHYLPMEKKESFRWIKSVRLCHELCPQGSEFVHISDRESDFYEMLRECINLKEKFIIRANHNRSINKTKRREAPKDKLWTFIDKKRVLGTLKIKVQVNGRHKFRVAELDLKFSQISVPPPPYKTRNINGKGLVNLNLWCIYIKEKKPPKNVKGLEWLLLTNIEVTDFESARQKVFWYGLRWNIEIFHKILKTGCGVERSQLRTGDRLKNMISLMSVIGWRIFWLSREFKSNPNKSCETILLEYEWRALLLIVNRRVSRRTKPPPLKEVLFSIAKLGGFLGRTGDGYPGFISIWRGWMKLMDLSEIYLIMKNKKCG